VLSAHWPGAPCVEPDGLAHPAWTGKCTTSTQPDGEAQSVLVGSKVEARKMARSTIEMGNGILARKEPKPSLVVRVGAAGAGADVEAGASAVII
jgi:hypothetical protein